MSGPETEETKRIRIVPLARVQHLTDVLFALAMMMVVLQIDYPDPELVKTDAQIEAFLDAQFPSLIIYVLTFVLIAIYWVKHVEHFSFIREFDYRLLWLQLGFLLVLVLMPVMNAYAVLYPLHRTVFINYCVALVGMGIFSALSWRYASTDDRLLHEGTEPELVRDFWLDALIEPFAGSVAAGTALFSVKGGQLALFLIPVAFALQRWRRRRRFKHRG